MIFFLVSFFLVFVPGGQTDGQTDGQKATPKRPPCMSTGGRKHCGGKVIRKSTFPEEKCHNFISSRPIYKIKKDV